MIIVLFGKPGGGKGTQAPLLAAALGVPTLATGDELRAAVRDRTPMGLAAKAAMERGELVPDDVILGILKDALSQPRFARGAVLDGVVRTVPQAQGLDRMLGELGRKLDAVLYFDVPDDVLVQRLSARTVCEKCQTPYTGVEPGSPCTKPGCGGLPARHSAGAGLVQEGRHQGGRRGRGRHGGRGPGASAARARSLMRVRRAARPARRWRRRERGAR